VGFFSGWLQFRTNVMSPKQTETSTHQNWTTILITIMKKTTVQHFKRHGTQTWNGLLCFFSQVKLKFLNNLISLFALLIISVVLLLLLWIYFFPFYLQKEWNQRKELVACVIRRCRENQLIGISLAWLIF